MFDPTDHPASADAWATTSERLTQLEIKASFTEDLLDQLNEIVIRQQDQIDRLTQELHWLRQSTSPDGASTPRSLRDELPPHY